MKRHGGIFAAALLAALSAFGAAAFEADLTIGLNVDVASFGVEHKAPELALDLYFGDAPAAAPALRFELSAWGDRSAFAASLGCRVGGEALSVVGWAGATAAYDRAYGLELQPTAEAGCRIAWGRFVATPLAAVRIKKDGDTDTDLRALLGWSF